MTPSGHYAGRIRMLLCLSTMTWRVWSI